MPKDRDPLDPKGLIREAYRIDGIDAGECRSIFLDWALSLPEGQDTRAAIEAHIRKYGGADPGHPMTGVLNDGLKTADRPRRRGGWRARGRG